MIFVRKMVPNRLEKIENVWKKSKITQKKKNQSRQNTCFIHIQKAEKSRKKGTFFFIDIEYLSQNLENGSKKFQENSFRTRSSSKIHFKNSTSIVKEIQKKRALFGNAFLKSDIFYLLFFRKLCWNFLYCFLGVLKTWIYFSCALIVFQGTYQVALIFLDTSFHKKCLFIKWIKCDYLTEII